VLALSHDKDVMSIVAALARLAPRGTLIATRTRSERAMPPERIAGVSTTAGFRALVAPDVPTACRLALEATEDGAPVLLTGSLFAVGEAMEVFGGAPGEML
jgi:folylpolyglutamate synthase/dihydropteroate synthase